MSTKLWSSHIIWKEHEKFHENSKQVNITDTIKKTSKFDINQLLKSHIIYKEL